METIGQRPTETKLAYLAGYLDADGCIQYSGGTPRVTVVSVFTGVLEEFRYYFGGTIGSCSAKDRPVWRWFVSGEKAMTTIQVLLPHLFEKRAQADLVIHIRETRPGPFRDGLVSQLKGLKNYHYYLKRIENPNSN